MQISAQTDKNKLRKNVTSNKSYTLKKIGLKFENLKFNIMQ